MKILFLFSSSSQKSKHSTRSNAYCHRILNIEQHCRRLGAETDTLFLKDLFFKSPLLIQTLNLPSVLRYLRSFDVVHAGGPGAAFFCALATRLIGHNTIVVYDVHSDALTERRLIKKNSFDFAGYFTEFQTLLTEYVALRGTKYFIASSPEIKRRFLKRKPSHIKPENVEVILNGVDLEQFVPEKDDDTWVASKPHMFTVTYAGSFSRIEAVDNLISAAEMLSNVEDINFKFIGFSEEEFNIKINIQKRLGNRALLIDWLPRSKLLTELQKSDVLVIPADASTREQSENRSAVFVTKFAEFLAVGKPVIVTELDLTSKIVETFDCGFVCKPTVESIAEAILKAKGTSRDILFMKGQNGRRFAETELDENLICKKYLQFLNRIIKQNDT
jgi:glycosyltransferase involved in cell wall biosynthesis